MAAFAYLARVLTPAGYGIVEQALAITVFFVVAVESGTGLYGARIVAALPERVPQLVPQVMLLRALFGLPAFGVVLAVASRYHMDGLSILAVNGIAVLLAPFLTQWVFQGLRQMPWVAAGVVARNLTFVALVLALVRPGSDIRLVAVAEVCGIAVLALVNAYFLRGRLGVRLDASGMFAGTRRLLGEVWVMGFSDLAWASVWYSPVLAAGWAGTGGAEQVAWVSAGVRIVLAVHTFVYLYLFNLLPNLALALSADLDRWRVLMTRSIAMSIWPACLIALGGTLVAPVLIPAIYGAAFDEAILPFQIAIWMIPATWFSGHFRFSLIAAGQQRWEFGVTAASALVTIGAGVFLSHHHGSSGAATSLVLGGVTGVILGVAACRRHVGVVPVVAGAAPAILATALCLAIGSAVSVFAGALPGTVAACLLFVAIAAWRDHELAGLVRRWIAARR